MKNCLLLVSISAVLLGGGCAKSGASSGDASANLENSSAVVQSNSLENQDGSLNSTPTFVAKTSMHSKFPGVTVMNDGFGNTVEKRFFDNHPRIICVVVRTNANGEKVATVYGHNGDRRPLPEYKIADAFTDDANRLADVAGIWEGRKVEEKPLPQFQTVVSETLPTAAPTPETMTKAEEIKKEGSETPTNNSPIADEKSSSQSDTKNNAVLPNPKSSEK